MKCRITHFSQTVKVHQETVETYLEDIIMESVEQTADAQARKEIQEMADRVNEAAYEMEATYVKFCIFEARRETFFGQSKTLKQTAISVDR